MVAFGGDSLANGDWMQQIFACLLSFFWLWGNGKMQ